MPPRQSWVASAAGSDFPLQHLPLGVRRRPDESHALVTRIGDRVADLRVLAEIGILDDCGAARSDFAQGSLNALIGRGKTVNAAVRARLTDILDAEPSYVNMRERAEIFLLPAQRAQLVLPVAVGDYTDFYASRAHATNVGAMFRDPAHALLPNWRHLPVAYHGRASSIVVGGTPVRRPRGQWAPDTPGGTPGFGASRQLDFELELAFVIGAGNALGEPVPVAGAERHIFGVALFNDWSARDLQAWEYQPLGPFLGKSFASSLAPWITPLEALDGVRVEGPAQEPTPLEHLRGGPPRGHLDLALEAWLQPAGARRATCVTRTNARGLYWSFAQQLAHHTSNGCNLRPGDLCASGTISGEAPGSQGCLLELTRRGTEPLELPGDRERAWLEDGDIVELRGRVQAGDVGFALAPCAGVVTAAPV